MKGAIELHLRHEPAKESRGRIKRLRGLERPQYRLRVEEVRVFYDVVTQPGRVALPTMKDDFSRYLKLAADGEIVMTRHGRPAGVLIAFDAEEDWFEYRLEHHPEFLRQIAEARAAIREARGAKLEDLRV